MKLFLLVPLIFGHIDSKEDHLAFSKAIDILETLQKPEQQGANYLESFAPQEDLQPIYDWRTESGPRTDAATLLLQGVEHGHVESIKLMGEISLYGKYGFSINTVDAFDYYYRLSELGDPFGQYMVGILYATGMGVPRDYQRALVYMGFSVLGNETLADQAMAFWHSAGIIDLTIRCRDAQILFKIIVSLFKGCG